jgi:hypothetical protein
MRVKKRWLLGAISGFFFGFFLGLTLLGFGAYALDSKMIVYLPIIFMILGIAGALWGPRGTRPPKPATVAAPDVSSFTGTPADATPPSPPPADPLASPPVNEPPPPTSE